MCPGGRVFNVNEDLKKLAVNFDFGHSNLGKALLSMHSSPLFSSVLFSRWRAPLLKTAVGMMLPWSYSTTRAGKKYASGIRNPINLLFL